jgi:hypothetical protein
MWNLVCDSSCDMKSAVLEPDRLKLEVVPMRIQVGGQDYTDDETLSVPSLLEAMRQEKSASSTACPAPGAFAKAFEEAECSICFTISGSLSGTYNAGDDGPGYGGRIPPGKARMRHRLQEHGGGHGLAGAPGPGADPGQRDAGV